MLKAKEQRAQAVGMLLILCAALLLGAVLGWAQPCEGMLELANGNSVHMKCFNQKAVGSVMALLWLSFGLDSLKNKRIVLLPLLISALAVLGMTFDWMFGIGICANSQMACHTTALWMRGLAVAVVLGSTVAAIDPGKQL